MVNDCITMLEHPPVITSLNMKNLCITGSVKNSVDSVAYIIEQAGALPSRAATLQGGEFSMHDWHVKVNRLVAGNDASQPAPRLGRLWEQLAGELLLANHDRGLWYWSSTPNIYTLDFWREFDEQTVFLLIYTSPQEALLKAIQDGSNAIEPLQVVLNDWYQHTQSMLRFHLRHPTRSLLVQGQHFLQHAPQYTNALNKHWQLGLTNDAMSSGPQPDASQTDETPLAHILVEAFLQEQTEALVLHNEVIASLFVAYDDADASANANINADMLENAEATGISSHYQALATYLLSRQRLQAVETQLTQLEATNTELQGHIHKSRESLDALSTEKSRLLNTHQQQLQALNQERAKLAKERDRYATQAQQLQDQIDAQAKAHEDVLSQLRQTLKDVESENNLILNHLHATQEELERQLLDKQEKDKHLAALKQEHAKLQADQQALAKEKAAVAASSQQQLLTLGTEKTALQTQLDTQTKSHQSNMAQLRQTLKDVESENDLILSHLHETQEELERQLNRVANAETQATLQHQQIRSMLKQYPDYWDYEDLQISTIHQSPEKTATEWHFSKLYLGEHYLPELRIVTTQQKGPAGIIFLRPDSQSPAPLLRWPSAYASAQALPCIPEAGHALQGNNAALSALGTRDWLLLQTLVQGLITLLDAPAKISLPRALDTVALRTGLKGLGQVLSNWPTVMRYDTIALQAVESSDSYQCLALELHNLTMANQRWPQLHYRLATVDSPNQPFGENPRLEFPQSAQHTLKHWFAETDDARGPRLELRFARPDAMDIDVWRRLAAEDQLLIAGLLSTLSMQMSDLQQAQPATAQPWEDWRNMANTMRAIVAAHTSKQTQAA